MTQPPGFIDLHRPHHVCRLHRSLYGLKQAPRAWFHRLSSFSCLGFHGSRSDPSLFIQNRRGFAIYLLIYVNDILLISSDSKSLSVLLTQMSSTFPVKDLGELSFFLGVEARPHNKGMLLTQTRYILDLLHRAGMVACKPAPTPIVTKAPSTTSASLSDPTFYRSIVGGLQYVTLTWPDICFAVNKVCQFMQAPTYEHWQLVKCILRYLQGTSDHGLFIQHTNDHFLRVFCDADWAGNPIERKFTSGYLVYLGPNIISWQPVKQHTVARSSTKVEYKSLANTTAELLHLRHLLFEVDFPVTTSPTLWSNNLGATYLAVNPVFQGRMKQVEIDFHFV